MSGVRIPHRPPPFALHFVQSYGWQATPEIRSEERRVSPIGLAKGDFSNLATKVFPTVKLCSPTCPPKARRRGKALRRGTIHATHYCMWSVYIIRSQTAPDERYIGLTNDLKARLAKHNSGGSPHTSKYRPWKLETAIAFTAKDKAAAFERYLKTGSGYTFAKRHF